MGHVSKFLDFALEIVLTEIQVFMLLWEKWLLPFWAALKLRRILPNQLRLRLHKLFNVGSVVYWHISNRNHSSLKHRTFLLPELLMAGRSTQLKRNQLHQHPGVEQTCGGPPFSSSDLWWPYYDILSLELSLKNNIQADQSAVQNIKSYESHGAHI